MAKEIIHVPDIGGAEEVDVIEVNVAVGDTIEEDQALIVLESDKASMDVPAPKAGKVAAVLIKEGDKVSEGAAIIELEAESGQTEDAPAEENKAAKLSQSESPSAGSVAAQQHVPVPDIGGAEGVDVIEISVKVGDSVEEGDSLIVLESDKASIDIPSPATGTVVSIEVKEGAKVSEGDLILILSTAGGSVADNPSTSAPSKPEAPQVSAPPPSEANSGGTEKVVVPDIGGAEDVDVIEVSVAQGDEVSEGDSLIVLESDKASMEVPSPASGKVEKILVKTGDKVSAGNDILLLAVSGSGSATASDSAAPKASPVHEENEGASSSPDYVKPQRTTEKYPQERHSPGSSVYAGPAARKLARQLGVDLAQVKGSGPRSRILKDDVKSYVKSVLQNKASASVSGGGGSGIPPIPGVDFAKFGEIETVKMSKIHKVTALNMSRNWLNVPHVTQFDDADITELEAFRKSMKDEAEKAGVKLTPVPFLLKACAAALRYEPSFNVSLHSDGEHLVKKDYVHIGMAVATPAGLVVPVIRDVDKKGLFELAEESSVMAKKARDGKLLPKDMQGGCFTVSSLGAIGGTGFTPIVNSPEVGILGVSKASVQPVWNGKEFAPRTMLPLCLSYDHRAINGADAGRFLTYLSAVLSDVRRLIL